jgi:acetyl esterase/lipase
MKFHQFLCRVNMVSLILLAVFGAAGCGLIERQPASPGVQKDVEFGQAAGQRLLLDIYRPAQTGQDLHPAVVFIHGGGWEAGSKSEFEDIAKGLAGQGYVGFAVEYRLMKDGKNNYPAAVDDVQRAVRWVRAHAKDYFVDPNRIAALGGSAGGHLVSMLGTTDTRDNSDLELAGYSSRVNCVVDMFGPADLTRNFPNHNREGLDVQALLERFMGGPQPGRETLYREASPLYQIDSKTVPFLIFHGSADELVPVEQSRLLAEALKTAGVTVEYVEFEGEGHGFKQEKNNQLFITKLLEFLKSRCGS